jgi:hypothetical protein
MIDEMGMKGTRRGSAVVSPVHANFIVTEGDNARAEDALALAEEIRERVKREQGIELEYEVELWRARQPSSEEDDVTAVPGPQASSPAVSQSDPLITPAGEDACVQSTNDAADDPRAKE